MHKTYVTSGVCSRQIDIDIDDNKVITVTPAAATETPRALPLLLWA